MALQNEQYKKLAEDVGEAQRMRHDMRHHLITIKGYLELGKLESASGYIDGLVGKDHYNDGAAICDNHAVDMILRHYLGLAREDNVRVETDVRLPKVFAMADQDLCAVFGNLVENAVESCKRQDSGEKFITIKAKVIHDNMLALTVTNSYSGNIIRHGDDFVSQKHDGTGIGTWSVRSIAEKSGGNCKFTFADKVFKASVLFTP
ncbi:MAG: GHKL domain-containing protein [Angelakisella sp.]